MENFSLEECQTYLKKFQEISICHVCHGPLRSPDIVVCTSGHAVCRSCKERTSSCSLCKNSYSNIKPATLCQMVDVMPRFCRYNYSCNRILRDNDDHESWCEFRLVSCVFCSLSVECKAFLKHINDVHKRKACTISGTDFQRNKFLCDSRLLIDYAVTKLLDGHIFNIRYLYLATEKNLSVVFLFWPTSRIDISNFKFTLELCSIDNKVSFTFCREVRISKNTKIRIFNIADPILKCFDGRDVIFKTKISPLDVTQNGAETSCPTTTSHSSPDQSCSPSPAKKLKGL